MDKVITFFGYLQNYVVSGRRNGRTARGNGSSVRQKQEENKGVFSQGESGSKSGANINKDPSGSGLGSTSVAGKNSRSGEDKDDEDKTFKDAGFLCGKVEEVEFPPSKDVDNKHDTRFADVNIDAYKNQALLPPVESPCLSSSKVASKVVKDSAKNLQRQALGASPGKLHEYVSDTQDTLPSFNAAQDLPANQTEQRKRVQGEDRRGRSSLPDIFSTIGKPLVQVRQPSFYLPVRNKPTTLVSVTTELSPTLDNPRSPANDEKVGTKVPKLKKNKKKKKKKKNQAVSDRPSDNLAEQSGKTSDNESTRTSEIEGTGKLCAEVFSSGFAEGGKIQQERTTGVDGAGSGVNCNRERQQRPRTALGRWVKKRSNTVAPAPYQDFTSDARDGDSAQSKQVTPEDITTEQQQPSSKSNEPPFPASRTVLVSESKKNVLKFTTKADTINDQVSTAKKEDHVKIENDNEEKEQAKHETATKVDKTGYEKEAVEKSASKWQMEEEVTAPNGTCKAPKGQSSETLETSSSIGSGSDGTGHTCKIVHNKDNAESEQKRCEQRDGKKKKQLITLEMKSGLSEPPTVSKKMSKSKSHKRSAVKQQIEKATSSLAEEATHEPQARVSTENTSPPPEGQPHVKKQNFSNDSKIKKKVRFNLEHNVYYGTSSSTTVSPTSSYTGHSWTPRKPSTFAQQFRALTSTDCFPGGSSDPLPIPDTKPKWHGGGPCLPSIRQEKKRDMVQDFLETYRRKKERESAEEFEGFSEPEPEEVKRILEQPITAKLPRYQANWDPLPTERPPGRGGQGYCLGVLWAKSEKSFLSDSPSEDIPEMTRDEEETFVFQSKTKRCETPSHDSSVQEPATWCRASRLPKHSSQLPPSTGQSTNADGVALEDFENTPDI